MKQFTRNEKRYLRLLEKLLKTPAVKIKREQFLLDTFGDYLTSRQEMALLISEGPTALFRIELIDKKAEEIIQDSTMQASALSFISGAPGGLLISMTFYADMLQYFIYLLRLTQQLAYIYGYDNLWDANQLGSEARDTMILFLGILFKVEEAGCILRLTGVPLPTKVVSQVPRETISKVVYNRVIRRVLSVVGAWVMHSSMTRRFSQFVPLVSGLVTGGITLATFKPMGQRLQKELRIGAYYTERARARDLWQLNHNKLDLPQ